METGEGFTSGEESSDSSDSRTYSESSSEGSEREIENNELSVSAKELARFLVCTLCNGYLIDAQTSVECLHTFCRRCLLQKGTKRCPVCKINLKQKQPFKSDRALQSVVDKLFPQFEKSERENVSQFYLERKIKRKVDKQIPQETVLEKKRQALCGKTAYKTAKDEERCWGEEVCFQLVPWDGELRPLKKSYLRTSGQLRTIHIVKYVLKKLNLESRTDLEILCNGEVVGKEHNLTFLKRSRWHENEHLTLHYRLAKNII